MLFKQNQKRFYQELNGTTRNDNIFPDADDSKKFWGDIWSVGKKHNRNGEWLTYIRNDIRKNQQSEEEITSEMMTIHCRKTPSLKASGRDGVQGFWLKKLRVLHGRIAEQLNNILNGEERLPEWLTFGRTILCLNEPSEGNAVCNFIPIPCLLLMSRLMTGVIAEAMYEHLEEILPEEQEGCKRGSRGD